jgi:hypothetical protein
MSNEAHPATARSLDALQKSARDNIRKDGVKG